MIQECSECGGKIGVVESRSLAQAVRRRKKCLTCGHRTTTYEVSAELFSEIALFAKGQQRIQELLDGMKHRSHLFAGVIAELKEVVR